MKHPVGHHRWGVNLYGLTQCADCGVKAVAVPATGTFLVIDGGVRPYHLEWQSDSGSIVHLCSPEMHETEERLKE